MQSHRGGDDGASREEPVKTAADRMGSSVNGVISAKFMHEDGS